MYIATADTLNIGTTNLHLDVTSAVNILVYTDIEESVRGAEWTIFRHEDTAVLREYLLAEYAHTEGDPVLSQAYFLSLNDLQALDHRGVRPFRFTQQEGEAVFIPAGCAHQVSRKCDRHWVREMTAVGSQPWPVYQSCHRLSRCYICHC